jgi:hypothetical protein
VVETGDPSPATLPDLQAGEEESSLGKFRYFVALLAASFGFSLTIAAC